MIKKISMTLFILGSLIAILGGSFTFIPDTETITILLLIILGTFIGIVNISQEEEYGFLIAGGVFILASTTIINLLSRYILLDAIGKILNNFMIFIAPACIVVALRLIIEYASQSEWSVSKEVGITKQIYAHLSDRQKMWDIVILFAVAITFILLVLQLFFRVDQYYTIIVAADGIIIAIFFADLVILYRRVNNFRRFVKTNWLDIIAVIPLGMVFQIAKIVRVIRIMDYMARISRINRPSKFFSDRVKKI